MGGLHRSLTNPKALTVLSADGDAPDTPAAPKAPVPRRRAPQPAGGAAGDLASIRRRIMSGEANYTDIDPNLPREAARRLTPDNFDDIVAINHALFRSPFELHIAEGLTNAVQALDQGVARETVFRDPVRRKAFAASADTLGLYVRRAEAVRQRSGLQAGVPTADRMTFRYPDGRPAIELTPDAGRRFFADRRHEAAHDLIGALVLRSDTSGLPRLVERAATASAHARSLGDGVLIPNVDDRIDVANSLVATFLESTATQPERDAALQLLATTILIDEMPTVRATRLVLDLLPVIGNLREGEAVVEFTHASGKALAAGDYAAAAKHALSALLSFAGAATGLRGLARSAGKVAERAPGAEFVKASREVAKAQASGQETMPAQGVRSFVDAQDWAQLPKKHQRYAQGLFNVVKGDVGEAQIRDRLRKLGLQSVRSANDSGRTALTLVDPASGKRRIYDEATQHRMLRNILGFAFTRQSKGQITAFETKMDNAPYNRSQRTFDEKAIQRSNRDQGDAAQAIDDEVAVGIGHNRPPDHIDLNDGFADPASKAGPVQARQPFPARPLDRIDHLILLRLPIEQLDMAALARAFESAAFNPRGRGMKRVTQGEWEQDELEHIIKIVRNGLLQNAAARKPPIVADLLAGVMVRLSLQRGPTDHED